MKIKGAKVQHSFAPFNIIFTIESHADIAAFEGVMGTARRNATAGSPTYNTAGEAIDTLDKFRNDGGE